MVPRRVSPLAKVLLLLILLGAVGCSDSGGPRDELAPLVGTWRADVLLLTNAANPAQSVDLVAEGAQFTLSILGDGQYSASLSAYGQGNVEVGRVTVDGNRITIAPVTPPGASTVGTWNISGSRLIVDGETTFDFNQDGSPEDANVHLEFSRIEL